MRQGLSIHGVVGGCGCCCCCCVGCSSGVGGSGAARRLWLALLNLVHGTQ